MTLRATWLTDLHLDHTRPQERQGLVSAILAEKPDELWITGDIASGTSVERLLRELQEAVGVPIRFVLGNHDFYHSSIDKVRDRMYEINESESLNLHYLRGEEWFHEINETSCVIGVDGWGDGIAGNPASKICLSDWEYIQEFTEIRAMFKHEARLNLLETLGKEEARELGMALAMTSELHYENVYVLTHVPPWVGAAWHEGFNSEPDWQPWFVCTATGAMLQEFAELNPETNITVLTGHTHGTGVYQAAPNMVCHTGAAIYRVPEVQRTFVV